MIDGRQEGIVWPHVTALHDGRAFALGSDDRCAGGGASIGDPRTPMLFTAPDGWSVGAPLDEDRDGFVLLTLDDGRVLVAGGANAAEGRSLSTSRILESRRQRPGPTGRACARPAPRPSAWSSRTAA